MTIAAGMKLGPYEIVSPLGAGGMGEVWRARDTRLDREVAIKVLPERTARDEHALSRFRRETKALAALSHPNILMILDVGEHEGVTYAVMELLEGQTLRERLRGTGLDSRKALEIAAAVADGLAAAHARDIVHRDLKPENLFLTRDGVVKILDFGLARTDLPADPTGATVTATSQPGVVLGTVNYMSPEQVRGQPADARSDIFSLGCVLYEVLSGQPPFARETSAETMTAILRHHPSLPSAGGAHVPSDVESILAKCLEKSPDERFHSAHDLAFALRGAALRTGERGHSPRRPAWGRMRIVSVIALAAAASGLLYTTLARRKPRVDPIDSIAVLPFVNASGDPDQEYFVDGMTEALIADLAKIRALKVISRTSAMQFKGVKKTLPDIARELKVEAVVEGSVLRVGDRVRITAQLIHAPTDQHLWAESYDRDLRDILRLHSELARTIAHEIQVTLTPQEQARMGEGRPINPEAHQAYLKGRFYWNKRTRDGHKKAVEYFEQAVSLAPDWPLGHLGLADAYAVASQGAMRPHETMPKAKAAAAKALELDESLGEAHATLGLIAEDYDWDHPTAQREFERALTLSPNYATAHHWYALYLTHAGRLDEAIKETKKAQELDPLSLTISNVVGRTQRLAGHLDESESVIRKTLELGPDFPITHVNLAITLFLQGRHTEAIAEAREAVRLSDNAPYHAASLAYLCARTGRSEEARRILDELSDRSTKAYVAPIAFAQVYAGLGETDSMFEWLEKAYQERDAGLLNMLVDPVLAPARGDPRLADLVRRVGLPPLAPMPSTGVSTKPPGGKIMLVVLPFENLSRDPEQDYFSDGLTDEMISQLGRLNPQKLGVIARTSAMRYKGGTKGIDQIGRELGVGYLLEGSVRRAGERLRITAKLLQVSDQTQLWSQEFDRTLEDVLAVQADVAENVARSLALELLPETKASLSHTPQIDRAVHDLYLRGRSYWYRRTPAAMLKGIDYFNQVLQRQPDHARAYAALADSYNELAYHGHMAPQAAFPRARAAAQKAVDLDETLAEPHASLAFVAYHFDWDWPTVDRELRRAIELNPSYAEAHHWYSHLHMSMGRVDQSLEESQRALAIDPLEMLLNVHLGWHYLMAREYDHAVRQLRETLELDRGLYPTHLHLGRCLLAQGLHADAVATLEEASRLAPESAQAKTFLAAAYAGAGRFGDAQKILEQLKEALQRQYVSACDIAAVYAAWGKVDDAFTWLNKALDERSARLVELTVDPLFDPIRSDPRFADLVRRVGLPEIAHQAAPVADPDRKPSPGESP